MTENILTAFTAIGVVTTSAVFSWGIACLWVRVFPR